MEKKPTTTIVYVLTGLLLAFAIIMGMRGCDHLDDIFQPGERVVDRVDWGQYSPDQFAGKVFTYTRVKGDKQDRRATIIVLVPYPAGFKVVNSPVGISGSDHRIKLTMERSTGAPAGVYQLTVGDIPADLDRIIVQLDEGDHDIILADADDESICHPAADCPIPIMMAEVGAAGVNVQGFLVLPDRSTVSVDLGSGAGDPEVNTANITVTSEAPEIFFLSTDFSTAAGRKKFLLREGSADGRSWSYTHHP